MMNSRMHTFWFKRAVYQKAKNKFEFEKRNLFYTVAQDMRLNVDFDEDSERLNELSSKAPLNQLGLLSLRCPAFIETSTHPLIKYILMPVSFILLFSGWLNNPR